MASRAAWVPASFAVMCSPSASESMLVTRPMSSPCWRLIFTLSREPKSVSGSNTSA